MGGVAQSDVARLTERVTALVEQGLDVAEAYAAAKGTGTKATREHAKAMEKHAKAVRKHGERVAALRQRSVTHDGGVRRHRRARRHRRGGSVDRRRRPLEPWLWLGVSALTAVSAVRSRYWAKNSVAPEPPALGSTLSASDLRRDAIGWAEAQGLAAVRRQLVAMVPAVASLHPDAGTRAQGRRRRGRARARRPGGAARGARPGAPRAAGLAGRASPPPTPPSWCARGSSEGVAVYDRLLAAASTMLASPDLGRSSPDVLGPAADALTAYAAGLRIASGDIT